MQKHVNGLTEQLHKDTKVPSKISNALTKMKQKRKKVKHKPCKKSKRESTFRALEWPRHPIRWLTAGTSSNE